MANFNTYPPGALELPAGFKPQSRNPLTASGTAYFLLDALSVDNRIQAFVDSSTPDTEAGIQFKNGIKYIINENQSGGALPTRITDQYNSTDFGQLVIGDVVLYNSTRESGDRWELWFTSRNAGISGASGGQLAFVAENNQFYGYFNTLNDSDGGWLTIGGGATGNTGNTGADAVFGREYTQTNLLSDVNAGGEVHVSNLPDSNRELRIHREAGGEIAGFAGVTGDLVSVFYPLGTESSNDSKNPNVILSLYNATKKKTYAIRTSLKSDALSGDVLTIFEQGGSNQNSVELLTSDSGTGNWGADFSTTWSATDEVYVLAISDGIAGTDGAAGVTGQGITYAGLDSDGEMQLQYIDSAGDLVEPKFGSGIVSGAAGVTGDPGEIGFLLGASGASANPFWGNNNSGITNVDVTTRNEIWFTGTADASAIDGYQEFLVLPYSAKENSSNQTFIPYSFGFTSGDIITGTDYTKKPGTIYFYRKEDDALVLKSFIGYNELRLGGVTDAKVIIRGIDDQDSTGSGASRLGITTGSDIFVLPVPRGTRGQGITFGAVVDNVLFLDYIDADGNTFGRFSSVSGVSGNPGGMNPFNIPYTCVVRDGTGVASQNIAVLSAAGGAPAATGVPGIIEISGTAESDDHVYDYLRHPLDTISKTGFFTVFDSTDVTNFGVFRFKGGNAFSTDEFKVRYNIESHVAGNITEIIGSGSDDTPQKGFTTGNKILFALNVDGPKGFSGNTGIGFTYGNEYFISKSNARPTERTNGDILEPGDKWFCTDVGLEFTFLGAEANFVLGDPRVVGTGGNDGIVWVQTNNARQGKQGNKGEPGTPGTEGTRGATGIEPKSQWSTTKSYSPREAVFVDFNTVFADPGRFQSDAALLGNWGALGSGTTSGYFVVKDPLPTTGLPRSTTSQVPGDHLRNIGGSNVWDNLSPESADWVPVITNEGGPRGDTGPNGGTGDSITQVELVNVSESNAELSITISDFSGAEVPGSPFNVGNVRGPIGPAGTIFGTDNQIVYKVSGGAITTPALERIEINSVDRVIFNNYREKGTEGHLEVVLGVLTIDVNTGPVQIFKPSKDETITEVVINNMDTLGDGVTLYVIQNGNTVTWNVPSDSYKRGSNAFNNAFVSSQGFPSPGKIEFPAGGAGAGAFTFKDIDSTSNHTLAINFVQFVSPTT